MDRSRLPANRSYRFVNAIFGLMLVAAAAFRSTKVCAFPVPREYQHMQRDLYKFLERARDLSDVETTHRSYTMCQGVFQVFRRRLTIHQAIQFSNTLPAGIRALFTAEWEPLIDNVREGVVNWHRLLPFLPIEVIWLPRFDSYGRRIILHPIRPLRM